MPRKFKININIIKGLTILSALASIIPCIENLIYVIFMYGQGNSDSLIVEAYLARGEEQELTWLSTPGKISNTITLVLAYINPLLFFYWLIIGGWKKNKLFIICISLAMLNAILYAIAISSRAYLASCFIYYFYAFLIFQSSLNDKLKKKIKKIGTLLAIIVISCLSIVSISRFESGDVHNDTMLEWISIYAGESLIRFDSQMYDIKANMLGDNCFCQFKNILGFQTFVDIDERRAYWSGKTGIPGNVFYTFIGDFWADFGFFGTVIILVIVTSFLLSIIKHKKLVFFYNLIPLSLWYQVCLMGITYFPFKTVFGNNIIIINLLIYFIMFITQSLSQKKSINTCVRT